ncbi:hypothetical protein J41TS4_15110 [Paenibacillus apis]|uniref:Uncharacterized protein n=2 Tax=Paenibacillus apis TaxID=1792174 RepID=A0A919Y1R3_9BACL|nr:hypothetical protein J41TS4_15110 [Paenibacillus apis]
MGDLSDYVDVSINRPYTVEHFTKAGLLVLSVVPIAQAEKASLKAADEGASLIQKAGKWFKVKVMGKGKIDLTVKPIAENQKLQNAINQLYRPNATVGNGSTMDAIRHELNTGQLVGGKSHLQKGQERVKNLENILKKEQLSTQDKALAEALLQDLKAALSGK